MAKQTRKEAPQANQSGGNMIFVGIICLALGLGAGYYLGKSAETAASPVAASAPSAAQGAVMDPNAFLREEASLKAVLGSNPKDLAALIQLGNLYYDNAKFSDAVEWYGKALEIDPRNVSVRTDRGTSYWQLGQADPAIAEFQKSLEINPSHAQTLYNMGIVYLHGKNDIAGARKVWQQLLATNPDYPQRAQLQQMVDSLSEPAPGAAEATGAMPGAGGETKSGATGVEDLLKRMKKQP